MTTLHLYSKPQDLSDGRRESLHRLFYRSPGNDNGRAEPPSAAVPTTSFGGLCPQSEMVGRFHERAGEFDAATAAVTEDFELSI